MSRSFCLFSSLIAAIAMLATGCSSDSGGGGVASATTFTVSGNLDPGQSSSSLNYKDRKPLNADEFMNMLAGRVQPFAKTECSDGQFYDVYCISFSDTPTAGVGEVDCSAGGAFSIAGMPLNEPIGCFVRRYDSASATAGTGTTVGAVEIPAANLNGKSDSLVASGDVVLDVAVGNDGTITATVVSGDVDNDGTTNANFTPAISGVYDLTCAEGGGNLEIGLCKCFLGEDFYAGAGYMNQDDCLNDPNGKGAAITQTVGMEIGLYIYNATVNMDIDKDGQTIPSGSSLKAISIWAAQNGMSAKSTGGEGVTNLGGALDWSNNSAPLPTVGIAWDDNSMHTANDGTTDHTFMVPAFPQADPNTMTHGEWITWIEQIAAAAEGQGWDCTWGPGDSNGNQNDTNLDENIDCMANVMDGLRDSGNLPRIEIQSYCGPSGCQASRDMTDNMMDYYNATAQQRARVFFEGWDLDYPAAWGDMDNYTATGPLSDGLGLEPDNRFVFEPLIEYPNGAGFRQKNDFTQHFPCTDMATMDTYDVENAACDNAMAFHELRCVVIEELSIKFIGDASPYNVLFDTSETVVSARLVKHDMMGTTEVTPTGTTVLDMCDQKLSSGGGIFAATATAQ